MHNDEAIFSPSMKVSVICVALHNKSYNNAPKYHASLEHFFAHAPKVEYEVIIVDNGSINNEAAKFQEKFGDRVRVVALPKNMGFQKAVNAGAGYASGEYLLLHNPDIAVSEGMVDTLVAYMDTHTDVAMVGPKLLNEDGTIQDSYRSFYRPTDFLIKRMKFLHRFPYFQKRMSDFLMWHIDQSQIQQVDWMQTSCPVIRRSMFDAIGGMDEYFFLMMGDTDMARTFKDKGWKVMYYPHVTAIHGSHRVSGNGFWKSLFMKTAWLHLWEMMKYLWKWRRDWWFPKKSQG